MPDPLAVDAVTMPLEPDRGTAAGPAPGRADPGLRSPRSWWSTTIPMCSRSTPGSSPRRRARGSSRAAERRRWRSSREHAARPGAARPGMPEMDGFAVLEALRGEGATRDVPVIVVTGQSRRRRRTSTGCDPGVATVLRKGVFTPARDRAPGSRLALTGRACPGGPTQQLVRSGGGLHRGNRVRPVDAATTSRVTSRSPPTTSPTASSRSWA